MRSMLCLMLTSSLLLATSSTARADDATALLRCKRAIDHERTDHRACESDLAAALKGRDAEHAAAKDLELRLNQALAERDQAQADSRARATWAWGLGVTGTVLQAGAVAVLLAGGSKTIAVSLAGLGTAAAGSGVIVATW